MRALRACPGEDGQTIRRFILRQGREIEELLRERTVYEHDFRVLAAALTDMRRQRDQALEDVPANQCQWCGLPMPADRHGNQKYCSAVCINAAHTQYMADWRGRNTTAGTPGRKETPCHSVGSLVKSSDSGK